MQAQGRNGGGRGGSKTQAGANSEGVLGLCCGLDDGCYSGGLGSSTGGTRKSLGSEANGGQE